MAKSEIQVLRRPHIAAWYHLLSGFDLNGDPGNCFNQVYHNALDKQRPASSAPIAGSFGEFHGLYRSVPGRATIHYLPLISQDHKYAMNVLEGLSRMEDPPTDLPPLTRRALAPISNASGAALLQWLMTRIENERQLFWNAHFGRRELGLNTLIAEFSGYLAKHLTPLVNALYGALPQNVVVFVAESLSRRARSLQTDPHQHHVVLMPQGRFEHSMFQVLLALMRQKSDRVIRHHFPEGIQDSDDDPAARQMRFDAAMTGVHQLLLRYGPQHTVSFKDWALLEYQNTPRHPAAAVAGLDDLMLIPEDAVPAILNLVGIHK